MQPEDYMSFLMRLWRDRPGDAECRDWHGEIEHIQTGARWSFSTLDALLTFLYQALVASHLTAQPLADEAIQVGSDNRR